MSVMERGISLRYSVLLQEIEPGQRGISMLYRFNIRKDFLNWRCPKYYVLPRGRVRVPSSELLKQLLKGRA